MDAETNFTPRTYLSGVRHSLIVHHSVKPAVKGEPYEEYEFKFVNGAFTPKDEEEQGLFEECLSKMKPFSRSMIKEANTREDALKLVEEHKAQTRRENQALNGPITSLNMKMASSEGDGERLGQEAVQQNAEVEGKNGFAGLAQMLNLAKAGAVDAAAAAKTEEK